MAAATHPDRPGGGNPAAYAAASAAYAVLRTPWGRSEAYADLMASRPPSAARTARMRPAAPGMRAARALLLVPARIWHGRPWRLALRVLAAAFLAGIAAQSGAGGPAAAGVVTGPGDLGGAVRAGGPGPATGPVTVKPAPVPGAGRAGGSLSTSWPGA